MNTGEHEEQLLAFIGAEKGLLICVLIVMFCWKKEVGQKLALIVSCVNLWLTLIKSIVLRPRPFMEYPDRVKALVVDAEGAAKDVAAQGCERRIRRKRSSNDDSH